MARRNQWSKGVWKFIAISALSVASVQAFAAIYVVLAFKSNISVISENAPMCFGGMADFDSIAAAQAIGRLDLVSFLLTTGGILLGAFSLIGFWVIRREAMEEARDAALEEVKKILPLLGLDENKKGTYNTGGPVPAKRATRKSRAKEKAPTLPDPAAVSLDGAVLEKPGEADDDAQGSA